MELGILKAFLLAIASLFAWIYLWKKSKHPRYPPGKTLNFLN